MRPSRFLTTAPPHAFAARFDASPSLQPMMAESPTLLAGLRRSRRDCEHGLEVLACLGILASNLCRLEILAGKLSGKYSPSPHRQQCFPSCDAGVGPAARTRGEGTRSSHTAGRHRQRDARGTTGTPSAMRNRPVDGRGRNAARPGGGCGLRRERRGDGGLRRRLRR